MSEPLGFALRSVPCAVELHIPERLASFAKPRAVEFMKPADMYKPDSRFLLAPAVTVIMLEESLGFIAKGDWRLVCGSCPMPAGHKYAGKVWIGINI